MEHRDLLCCFCHAVLTNCVRRNRNRSAAGCAGWDAGGGPLNPRRSVKFGIRCTSLGLSLPWRFKSKTDPGRASADRRLPFSKIYHRQLGFSIRQNRRAEGDIRH